MRPHAHNLGAARNFDQLSLTLMPVKGPVYERNAGPVIAKEPKRLRQSRPLGQMPGACSLGGTKRSSIVYSRINVAQNSAECWLRQNAILP